MTFIQPQQPNPCPFHGRLIKLLTCTQDVKLYPINLTCIKWEMFRHCLNQHICDSDFHVATEPMPLFSLSSLPLTEPTAISLVTFLLKWAIWLCVLFLCWQCALATKWNYNAKEANSNISGDTDMEVSSLDGFLANILDVPMKPMTSIKALTVRASRGINNRAEY